MQIWAVITPITKPSFSPLSLRAKPYNETYNVDYALSV